MIHFIVPFRAPEASKDWEQVSRLCNGTLSSLVAQSHPDFRVHLVCHSRPNNFEPHPDITVHEANSPIPTTWEEMLNDKYRKIKKGLTHVRAGENHPVHVMIVDADDRVHPDIARLCNAEPDANGWFFDRGFVHPFNSAVYFKIDHDFHKLCGTSAIVRSRPEDLPRHLNDDNPRLLECGHNIIVECMEKDGRPLRPMPFAAGCYITDTDDNHSGVEFGLRSAWKKSGRLAIRRLLSMRPVTPSFRRLFKL